MLVTEETRGREFTVPKVNVHGVPKGGLRKGASGWYSQLQPVSLGFDQITAISQSVSDNQGGLAKHSFALKFTPSGLVPNYAFMNLLHSIYGEAAEKRATRNLGQYVIHVTGNKNIKADLVDPSKETSHSSFVLQIALAAYGAEAARTGRTGDVALAQSISAHVDSEEAQRAAARQQQADWATTITREVFVYFETGTFNEIEKLLDLV